MYKRNEPRVAPVEVICGQCGNTFKLMPAVYRQRMKISVLGKLYCSADCRIEAGRIRAQEKVERDRRERNR